MTPTSQVVSNTPNFFGVKVSIPGVNVNNAGPTQLLYESNYSTETWYGNGSAALYIGSLGNSSFGMAAPATNGQITFGLLSDGGLGMQVTDTNNNVLFEMDGQTWYWYDLNYGTNVMQVGLLPDGSYGWAVAAPGYNVSDGFS